MMTDDEIASMVRSFEEGSLPRSEWTHTSHLLVALWYLSRHPRDRATRLVRDGIRRYNHLHGRDSAYHETITLAWVAVVAQFLAGCTGIGRSPSWPMPWSTAAATRTSCSGIIPGRS